MQVTPELVSSDKSTETVCKNCNTVLVETAAFCHVCGQKHKDRLTFKSLFADFATTYLGFDGIFFGTIRNLLLRPGEMVKEYLAGKQKPYLKPIQYYLLTLGLYLLIAFSLVTNPLEIGKQLTKSLGITSQQQDIESLRKKQIAEELKKSNADPQKIKKLERSIKRFDTFNKIFQENLRILFSLGIPVFALATFLIYRKSKYNFIEQLVLSLYVYGTLFLFSILQVLTMPLVIKDVRFVILPVLILISSLIYSVWVIYQFFNTKGIKGWLYAIASYLLSYAFYLILILLISIPLIFFITKTV